MQTIFHPASERGHADHGWLDSWHSFSFAQYHNPERMHFGLLRVLNDDTVSGGMGFGRHPHENMEIVSIPLEGALKHSDSTGRTEIIKKGEVQIMSAGSGIEHSEVNASATDPVRFLQIWVFPKEKNIKPRYEQKLYDAETREGHFTTVVSPSDNEAVAINQDAFFSLGQFAEKKKTIYEVKKSGNGVYAFVIEGGAAIGDRKLGKRDALGVWDTEKLEIEVEAGSEILLIEVPMN
jgi:quercetin 2,3-dioxygenase